MRKFVLLALLLSAACDREATKTDASPPMASAAAAVPAPPSGASPEQVSPAPLALQDITMADIEKYDLSGMGCVFVPQGAKEAVVLLEDHESQLKIADALVRLPAAKDSKELDYGTRDRYSDGRLTLAIAPAPGKAISTGPESQEQPATVTIRDTAGREAYRATGIYECAA